MALITLKQLPTEKNVSYVKQVKIIYDGSLTQENTGPLFNMDNIDGELIGRYSINTQSFIKLFQLADQLKCGEIS